MKTLAKTDGAAFLPNIKPVSSVDYVFICMEPSLGRWARTVGEARDKVADGFRNFTSSIEDFILHFCIQNYLCKPTQRYHITDLSKGAMLVQHAGDMRIQRYNEWYGLLLEEMDIVGPKAGIFAVGNVVANYLARAQPAFPRDFTQVIHYSPLAGRARIAGVVGHEKDFESFQNSVTLADLIATAKNVLKVSDIPESIRDATLNRMAMRTLTESQQKLIFNYKLAFEKILALMKNAFDTNSVSGNYLHQTRRRSRNKIY